MSIESVIPSSHLILCRPLLLLPPIPPSIRVFSNESTLHMRWLKYWGFSFSISPSNEHPGLISFRIDWLDLLAVQGTLKSLLQHHSSKANNITLKKKKNETYNTLAYIKYWIMGGITILFLVLFNKLVSKELDTTKRLHFHFSLSYTGEGNGNPLQCSCLENPRDRGAWWAAVYRVAQSQTQLKWLSSSSSSSTIMKVYILINR